VNSPWYVGNTAQDLLKRFGSKRVIDTPVSENAMHFDPQSFHMDQEAAKKSLYGGLIASGIHTVAVTFRLLLMTGVLTNNIGSPGFDELRWLRPVRPGDTLRAVAEVIDVCPSSSRPERGTVRLRCATLNQRDETVQTVLCTQLLKRLTLETGS
jgi:acyl dehydratase